MAAFHQVQTFWDWGEWERDHFIQTGLEITQLRDGTISISFERAPRKVDMIEGCTTCMPLGRLATTIRRRGVRCTLR